MRYPFTSTRRALPLLWLPLGLALIVLSCAPVDPPSPENPNPFSPQSENGPQKKRPPLVDAPDSLRERIEVALNSVKKRQLRSEYGFWTVFHAILGLGPDVKLLDAETGEEVNAIDYIASGKEMPGLRFIPTLNGVDVESSTPLTIHKAQGHQDQYVAEMAQWGMPLDRVFKVNGKDYPFEAFVNHSQMRASTTGKQELSWAIIVVGQYRGTDYSWTNEKGEKITLHDIIRYELNEPIDEAACGGTHRLFGLTWVYHLHLKRGGKKEGIWLDVANKLEVQKKRAHKYQNTDGSFSTLYLGGPGNLQDMTRRINTTGHVLEWLALAMTDAELRQPWVQEAASALALMILQSSSEPVDAGSIYHAAHGLHLYHARVYGSKSGKPEKLMIPLPPEDVMITAHKES